MKLLQLLAVETMCQNQLDSGEQSPDPSLKALARAVGLNAIYANSLDDLKNAARYQLDVELGKDAKKTE